MEKNKSHNKINFPKKVDFPKKYSSLERISIPRKMLSGRKAYFLRVKNGLKRDFDFFLLLGRTFDSTFEQDGLEFGGKHGNEIK